MTDAAVCPYCGCSDYECVDEYDDVDYSDFTNHNVKICECINCGKTFRDDIYWTQSTEFVGMGDVSTILIVDIREVTGLVNWNKKCRNAIGRLFGK